MAAAQDVSGAKEGTVLCICGPGEGIRQSAKRGSQVGIVKTGC